MSLATRPNPETDELVAAPADPGPRSSAKRAIGLGFVIVPPILALLAALSYFDLFTGISVPIVVALIVATAAMSNVGYYLWPTGSRSHSLARTIVVGGGSTACIYATGWGPVLVLGHLAGAVVNATISGARACWTALVLLPFMVLSGQLAIQWDLAPTFVDAPEVHGLAFLTLTATMFTIFFVGQSTANIEAKEIGIRDSQERFRAIVQNASDILTVLGPDGDIAYASPACSPMLGITDSEIVGARFMDLVHLEDRDAVLKLFTDAEQAKGQTVTGYLRMSHAQGDWRWLEAVGTRQFDTKGAGGMVFSLRDVTEHKHLEKELIRLAFNDDLTGLPNRAWLMERLDQAVHRSRRQGTSTAVLFVDLDGFKGLNDSHGHEAGDAVLIEVAERLRLCVRQEDTVARLGGDEFLVLIEDLSYPEHSRVVAQRIIEAHSTPFSVCGTQVHITASVGISGSQVGATPDEIVAQADAAMYTAKTSGKHRFEFFADATDTPPMPKSADVPQSVKSSGEAP